MRVTLESGAPGYTAAAMTIREYIERRRNLIFFGVCAGWAAIALMIYLNQVYRFGIPPKASLFGFVGIAAIGLVIKQRIACPACRKPVGWMSTRSATGGAVAGARCPNCGASFDEPMKPAGIDRTS
jgi:hypothetical protein